jgi:endonuclease III
MPRKSPRSRRREPAPRIPGKGRPRATPGSKPANPRAVPGRVAARVPRAAHARRGARAAGTGRRPVVAARAAAVCSILERLYPDAATPLVHANALQLLVATILSAQCTDARVNLVTPGLFARYPDAAALAGADRAELEEAIRSTGFYRNKAKAIQACCAAIVERFGGEVPRTMAELVELPGVGRKTANVVLGSAYGVPGIVVDTHVQRLAGRLGFTRERDPVKIEFALQPLVPEAEWSRFSLWLIFHGRRVCVARKPRCSICPLSPHCPRLGVASAQ